MSPVEKDSQRNVLAHTKISIFLLLLRKMIGNERPNGSRPRYDNRITIFIANQQRSASQKTTNKDDVYVSLTGKQNLWVRLSVCLHASLNGLVSRMYTFPHSIMYKCVSDTNEHTSTTFSNSVKIHYDCVYNADRISWLWTCKWSRWKPFKLLCEFSIHS